jgi:putative phosphoesterase
MLIGIISDTHGLVRPEAIAALQGTELIVHAGDVGKPAVLDALRAVAPVVAVRGNVDRGPWATSLPETVSVSVGMHRVLVLHIIAELSIDPASEGYAAVIFGHSHKPSIQTRGGVLYINPGSAGPRRLRLPITLARVRVQGSAIEPELVELDV